MPSLPRVSQTTPEAAADYFKVLADPTRLHLLYLIASNPRGQLHGSDLSAALEVSAPTITHHMKRLSDAGLVTRHREGKWARYSIVEPAFRVVDQFVHHIANSNASSGQHRSAGRKRLG